MTILILCTISLSLSLSLSHSSHRYNSLLFHSAWSVVKLSEVNTNLMVDRRQELFSGVKLLLCGFQLCCGELLKVGEEET